MRWDWQVVAWAASALLLFALEAMVPGAFMLWLGLAAAAVFVVVVVFDIPLLAQVALFVVLSFVSIQVYRRWVRVSKERGGAGGGDRPTLNRRAEALVGQVVPLERAIVSGRGRVQIADAFWDVSGPDLAAGTPVRVVAVEGMSLKVEAAR